MGLAVDRLVLDSFTKCSTPVYSGLMQSFSSILIEFSLPNNIEVFLLNVHHYVKKNNLLIFPLIDFVTDESGTNFVIDYYSWVRVLHKLNSFINSA